MPLAVATRTLIRRRWRAKFMWGSLRVALHARRSPGYLGGALRVSRGPVFWTLTVWQDGAAMNGFRTSGEHGELMPKLAVWASQACTTAWRVEGAASWDETFERMALNARWVEIDRPDHWHRENRMETPSTWGLTVPIPPPLIPQKSLAKG